MGQCCAVPPCCKGHTPGGNDHVSKPDAGQRVLQRVQPPDEEIEEILTPGFVENASGRRIASGGGAHTSAVRVVLNFP
jgi:hypothetical protein